MREAVLEQAEGRVLSQCDSVIHPIIIFAIAYVYYIYLNTFYPLHV